MWQTTWTVPADHPALAGHFPGRPIVPGVVLLDHGLQLLANARGQSAALLKIGTLKFLSPVTPGETVHFELQSKTNGTYQLNISAAARQVAKAVLTPLSDTPA